MADFGDIEFSCREIAVRAMKILQPKAHLFDVGLTLNLSGGLSCELNSRQQQSHQNRHDRDNDKKFDHRKTAILALQMDRQICCRKIRIGRLSMHVTGLPPKKLSNHFRSKKFNVHHRNYGVTT